MFLILVTILILLITFKIRSCRNYWKRQGLAQIHGTTFKFILQKRSLGEVHKDIYDAHPDLPAIGIHQGTIPAVLLRNIKNVQAVLAGDFQSFYKRGGIINEGDILSRHLFNTDDYPNWKYLRQNMTTVATNCKLRSMFGNIDQSARNFIEFLDSKTDVNENFFDSIYFFSTESTGSGLFGFNPQAYDKSSIFLKTALSTLKPGFFGNIRFFIGNMSAYLYKLLDLEYSEKFKGVYSKFTKQVLNVREGDIRNDYTDIFVKLKKNKIDNDLNFSTNEMIASQFFFSFQAGGEVSSIIINFVLLELSNNKKILDKVHEEIDEVFDRCGEKFTYDECSKLEYLQMVINEGLRLYPPISTIQRLCTKDTILPVGDIKMRKGDLAIIPILSIHRDENFYHNPRDFDPERFSSNNSKPAKFSYLPFGEGNRICVGERFARLQVKVGLAWILRRYTLEGTGYKPSTFDHHFITLRISHSPYKLIKRARFS